MSKRLNSSRDVFRMILRIRIKLVPWWWQYWSCTRWWLDLSCLVFTDCCRMWNCDQWTCPDPKNHGDLGDHQQLTWSWGCWDGFKWAHRVTLEKYFDWASGLVYKGYGHHLIQGGKISWASISHVGEMSWPEDQLLTPACTALWVWIENAVPEPTGHPLHGGLRLRLHSLCDWDLIHCFGIINCVQC